MRVRHQHTTGQTVRVQTGDLSPDAQKAWKFLRDAGGWYTAGELAAELLPSQPLQARASMTARWLFALNERMHVALHPNSHKVKRYGVTARCFPIPGESIDPAPVSPETAAEA